MTGSPLGAVRSESGIPLGQILKVEAEDDNTVLVTARVSATALLALLAHHKDGLPMTITLGPWDYPDALLEHATAGAVLKNGSS